MNFSITQQQCEDALNQLSNANNNTINVELASDWLAMHQSLKEDTSYYLLHGGIIKKFRAVYTEIDGITKLITKDNEAGVGVLAFNLISSDDNEAILNWLVKHEEFGHDLEFLVCDLTFDLNDITPGGLVTLKNFAEIYYQIDNIKHIPAFLNIFSERYWSRVREISGSPDNESSIGDYFDPEKG